MAERKKDYKVKDYTAEYGKLPPQALDLEEAVLGALLLEFDEAFPLVGDILEVETFYKPANQKIYNAIKSLESEGKRADVLTVKDALEKSGELEEAGGIGYLSSLTSSVLSAANIEFHAKILAQKFIRRRMITSCTELQNMSYDEGVEVSDLIAKAQQRVYEIADSEFRRETVTMAELMPVTMESVKKASENLDGINGIPTGFVELDRIIHGWQPSDLIIIAARPAMGKTALAISMARNMAVLNNTPIAIFSLEMSALQLGNRLLSVHAEVRAEDIKTGQVGKQLAQLQAAASELAKAPIYVDDTPALSVLELRSKCRILHDKHHIEVFFVDYLQLMTAGADLRGNREQEVSMISRQLKIIAKELGVTVIALSQMNRRVESRTDNKPLLSDLRESGSIEQDADMVIFIHRPEVINRHAVDEDGNSMKGVADIIIAKHRNGAIGTVRLRFKEEYTQFLNWDTIPLDTHERTNQHRSSIIADSEREKPGLDDNFSGGSGESVAVDDFDDSAPF